jgi:hypothetical protein
MKRILFAVALLACACSTSDEFHVVSYRNVSGVEAKPWETGCLAVVESRTQRASGVRFSSCDHIAIADKAVFNHKGDNVFWINDQPYNVKSAEAK